MVQKYSVSMETELKSLEEKIFLLLRLYQDTCIENNKLRTELADTYAQNEKLNEKNGTHSFADTNFNGGRNTGSKKY